MNGFTHQPSNIHHAPSTRNACNASGQCTGASEACRFYAYSTGMGGCIWGIAGSGKCLSPFALVQAREDQAVRPDKKSYCVAPGYCTAQNYAQESACAHYEQGPVAGICIKRAWCDVCLSHNARTAAAGNGFKPFPERAQA